MANIGDKYVIEIDSKMTNKNGTLYGIKGFKSLVFDEDGLSKLEKRRTSWWKIGDIVRDRDNGRIGIIYWIHEKGFYVLWDDDCLFYFADECERFVWQGNVWNVIKENEKLKEQTLVDMLD